MTALRAGSATHVGRVRQVNQDRLLATETLWVVADGMGGHQAGEVAAEVAVAVVADQVATHGASALAEAVVMANDAVIDRAHSDPGLAGMGTTVTALAVVAGPSPDGSDDVLVLANVGDSRTYLLRAESAELEQVTEDHSLVATLERQGQLSADEAATHPQRNIITRALGVDATVLVDTWELAPVAGDRYLMCSDGLSNEVTEAQMASVLRRLGDPGEAAAELVRMANAAGGRDNVTVVVVDVVDAALSAVPPDGRSRVVAARPGGDDSLPAGAVIAGSAPPSGDLADPGAGSGAGDGPGAGGAPTGVQRGSGRAGPRSRFTWRVAVFLLVLALLAGATFGIIGYAARNTYFVGVGGDAGTTVVVYRGQPGGVLWFDPTVEEVTDVDLADLNTVSSRLVTDDQQAGSLDDARALVANLRDQRDAATTTTSTSTTSTTTSTTTSSNSLVPGSDAGPGVVSASDPAG